MHKKILAAVAVALPIALVAQPAMALGYDQVQSVISGQASFADVRPSWDDVEELLHDLSRPQTRQVRQSCTSISRGAAGYPADTVRFCDLFMDAAAQAEDEDESEDE